MHEGDGLPALPEYVLAAPERPRVAKPPAADTAVFQAVKTSAICTASPMCRHELVIGCSSRNMGANKEAVGYLQQNVLQQAMHADCISCNRYPWYKGITKLAYTSGTIGGKGCRGVLAAGCK